jgi:hypothetical protein
LIRPDASQASADDRDRAGGKSGGIKTRAAKSLDQVSVTKDSGLA